MPRTYLWGCRAIYLAVPNGHQNRLAIEQLPSSNVSPHLVGIGVLLAATAMPLLSFVGSDMAFKQARHGDGGRQPLAIRNDRLPEQPVPSTIEVDEDTTALPAPLETSSSPEESAIDLSLALENSLENSHPLSIPHSHEAPITTLPKHTSAISLLERPPATPSIDISSLSRHPKSKTVVPNATMTHNLLSNRSTPSLGSRNYRQSEDVRPPLSLSQQSLLLKKHYLQSQVSERVHFRLSLRC